MTARKVDVSVYEAVARAARLYLEVDLPISMHYPPSEIARRCEQQTERRRELVDALDRLRAKKGKSK